MPTTVVIAICSDPDCSRHAEAQTPDALPAACPACGQAMIARCWKCEAPLTDPSASYCAHCGVPLKRVLPRADRRVRLLAICGNPDCDGAIAADRATALPSRCPECGAPLVSCCWKCGTQIVDLRQHYCQTCGVPLKRHTRSA